MSEDLPILFDICPYVIPISSSGKSSLPKRTKGPKKSLPSSMSKVLKRYFTEFGPIFHEVSK
jgi:hypothetical protein